MQAQEFQERILRLTDGWEPPLDAAIVAAFRALPRHAFVDSYLVRGKRVAVNEGNLGSHLAAIYHNAPLAIWADPEGRVGSTLSQPTLVLWMLQLMELRPGLRVLEVGTGSGWNAAMIGHIVGPAGRVVTMEIVPELAERARRAIARCGPPNVEVVAGDGGEGHAAGAPYDRAVFTAGAYDLPPAFHGQVRPGGLLLFILRLEQGSDLLLVLRKGTGYFESLRASACAFVPLAGRYGSEGGDQPPPAGKPEAPGTQVRIFPSTTPLAPRPGETVIRRPHSTFVWTQP